jgi:hypothetical protein
MRHGVRAVVRGLTQLLTQTTRAVVPRAQCDQTHWTSRAIPWRRQVVKCHVRVAPCGVGTAYLIPLSQGVVGMRCPRRPHKWARAADCRVWCWAVQARCGGSRPPTDLRRSGRCGLRSRGKGGCRHGGCHRCAIRRGCHRGRGAECRHGSCRWPVMPLRCCVAAGATGGSVVLLTGSSATAATGLLTLRTGVAANGGTSGTVMRGAAIAARAALFRGTQGAPRGPRSCPKHKKLKACMAGGAGPLRGHRRFPGTPPPEALGSHRFGQQSVHPPPTQRQAKQPVHTVAFIRAAWTLCPSFQISPGA